MKTVSLPNKIEDALPALNELLRRAPDTTTSPLFVDEENQRVLIRSTTASAGTSVFEIQLWGSITTAGIGTYLSTANFRSAVNITGASTLEERAYLKGGLSVTGNTDVYNGETTLGGGVSCTGLAKFQNSFTDFLGDLRVTGNTNSSGTSNWTNVTAGGLNITSTANFRSAVNVTGSTNLLGSLNSNAITAATITVTGAATAPPVANQIVKDNIIKAWAKFNSAISPLSVGASFNLDTVTPISDNGVGDVTLNWDTNFSTVEYAFSGMCGDVGVADGVIFPATSDPAAGSMRIMMRSTDSVTRDMDNAAVIAIGNQ